MNGWRIIVLAVGLFYVVAGVALGILHTVVLESIQTSLLALAVIVCGLAVLAGQSRKMGSDPLRFGAMLFLGLFIPLFAVMAMMLFGGVARLVLENRDTADTLAMVAGGLLVVLNIVCIIALVRIGKLERARRRAARRARFADSQDDDPSAGVAPS